jgi:hypothetical protein
MWRFAPLSRRPLGVSAHALRTLQKLRFGQAELLSVGAIQGDDSSSLGLKPWWTRPFTTAQSERFA